jgi:hypothetical protein
MSRLRPLPLSLLLALLALAAPAAARADFGIKSFSAQLIEADESPAIQAGSHPFEFKVKMTMNQDAEERPEGTLQTLVFELPPGLVGDPLSLPRCSRAAFDFNLLSTCPGNTQVGIADVEANRGGLLIHPGIYNLTPTPGAPVTLGLVIDNNTVFLDASLRTGSDYGASVADPVVPTREEIQTVTTHVWGLPMASAHDPQRYCIPDDPELGQIEGCSSDALPAPFLSLPTRCGVPLQMTLRVGSVQGDSDEASLSAPALAGCETVPFAPQIKARPETAAADSPTGLAVQLKIPQSRDPKGLASAHLKDSVVTLPAGLAVNPSAASGRAACSEAQIDLGGPGPANCPDAAKVGTVEVSSPLVDHPLAGSVYLAKQSDNPFGSLIALYLAVNDPLTGVVVKQAIEVVPDPATGQLTATVTDAPQLPFEVLDFDFFGGPRAALTTPPTCATYTTHSVLTPWSSPQGKAKEPSDSFAIAQGAGAGPCPANEAQMPFAPGFEAGTTSPLAGAYSPFVLKLTRENGSQHFKNLSLALPPGVAARLAGVSQCSDAELAAAIARSKPGEGILEREHPSCPSNSQLGTATVGAGSGSPIYVSGSAYLAGPYKGAPISVAIVTPAIAGPFDLGTVVVRSALYVNESTAQVTVKSDDIPQILEGIPLDIRSVAVKVDRSTFTLNPTSCQETLVSGELTSNAGAVAPLSNRFQVAGCKGLEFKPNLQIRFKGASHRRAHPKVIATLTAKPGEANTAFAQVKLPKAAFLDNAHIGTVCTRVQFAAEACPAASIYGRAEATTPLLGYPLTGTVYLRSSSNPLPDLIVAFKGPAFQPIKFDLAGKTDSVKGALRNTFETAPDVPVSKFRLELFGGDKGLVILSSGFCKNRAATIKLRAHSGKAYETTPNVKASCGKKKK